MSTGFIDFAALKERISIHQVAISMLALQLTQKSDQYRGTCPIHKGTNPREFVITASKGLFFCFGGCGGGDQIQLVAKVRDVKVNEAANLIASHFGTVHDTPAGTAHKTKPATKPPAPTDGKDKALQPLQYLEATHPKVQELGISPETAQLFLSGYAAKGVLRGRYAVPVHSKDGTLLAYVGIAVEKEQSPRLLFHNFEPSSAIWNAHRILDSGDLYVVGDPLRALLAVENGVEPESVVSFLTDGITAMQFEQLASLMDEKKIETVELF